MDGKRQRRNCKVKLGLENKVVLITGGSKGIGLACAHAFAGEGARVAIASRSHENLDRARQTLTRDKFEVLALRGDMSRLEDAQAVAATTEKMLGPIDRSEERRVGKECRSRWSPYH